MGNILSAAADIAGHLQSVAVVVALVGAVCAGLRLHYLLSGGGDRG